MNKQKMDFLRRQANQYEDAHLPQVNDYIDELRPHNITHCCYRKIIQNESFMRLCPQNSGFGSLI